MFKRLSFLRVFALSLILLIGGAGLFALTQPAVDDAHAIAGAEIVGNPEGATSRALVMEGERVIRVVYVDAGVHTPVSGTTPEAYEQCGLQGDLHKLQFVITDTMTGTSPTLNVEWQNSIDGVNWTAVSTVVPINATSITTPANTNQSFTVADVRNDVSSKAYGDCWRALVTYGGTGSVGGNYSIKGIEK
jgi:hypothetical protein